MVRVTDAAGLNNRRPRRERAGGLLASGAGLIFIKIMNAALGVASVTVFARFLPPENYGVYVLALTVAQFLAMPLQMGLPTLLTREIAARPGGGSTRRRQRRPNLDAPGFIGRRAGDRRPRDRNLCGDRRSGVAGSADLQLAAHLVDRRAGPGDLGDEAGDGHPQRVSSAGAEPHAGRDRPSRAAARDRRRRALGGVVHGDRASCDLSGRRSGRRHHRLGACRER